MLKNIETRQFFTLGRKTKKSIGLQFLLQKQTKNFKNGIK